MLRDRIRLGFDAGAVCRRANNVVLIEAALAAQSPAVCGATTRVGKATPQGCADSKEVTP
jgi:hypothetical protein